MGVLLSMLLVLQAQAPRNLTVAVTPESPLQGQLVVIEVLGAQPGDRVMGTFAQRKLRFFIDEAGRVRALAAVPLAQKPGSAPLTIQVKPPRKDLVIQGIPVPVRAGSFDTQELKVDPRFVEPPREVIERIKKESAAMKKLWRQKPTARLWRNSFTWPRRDKICSHFGLKRMFNKQLKSRHYGLDIDGKMGEPVRAIGAGRVVMVADRYYSGGTIVIDHGLRLFSLYFHLSEFLAEEGQKVEKGQLIGRVGESGRVTGPHLHLGVRVENVAFDPVSLLEADLSEGGAVP